MFSVKFSTLLVSICTAILSFIGVSCSNEEEMYGTPTADFISFKLSESCMCSY